MGEGQPEEQAQKGEVAPVAIRRGNALLADLERFRFCAGDVG